MRWVSLKVVLWFYFVENRKPPQGDYYTRLQKLQREIEFYDVQEEYIKDEMRNLRKEYLHAQEEVKRIQSIPLVLGQFLEAIDQFTAIVGSTTGQTSYVRVLSTIDRELLKLTGVELVPWFKQI